MSLRGIPKNVLVVEGDGGRASRLALMINRFGYNVFVADNDSVFHRIVNGVLPNIVLINLKMPLVDNKTYLEILREKKSLDLVKAVTYSEAGDGELLKDSLTKGADACTTIPVKPFALFEILEKLTETRPRKAPRVSVILKVTVATKDGKGTGFATSFSEAGLFIRTSNPLPVDTLLKLAIELPATNSPITLDGKVIYIKKHSPEDPTEPGMAILFADMAGGMKKRMRSFVDSLISAELSPDIKI
ncbi:MAG: PilZ domain-containing protein [Deltaproteobacteria bacterium]|nr:PilZ domain-containing protein [Deltaproteobacteria bacterium]